MFLYTNITFLRISMSIIGTEWNQMPLGLQTTLTWPWPWMATTAWDLHGIHGILVASSRDLGTGSWWDLGTGSS